MTTFKRRKKGNKKRKEGKKGRNERKKEKAQEWNDSLKLLPKSSHVKTKATSASISHLIRHAAAAAVTA